MRHLDFNFIMLLMAVAVSLSNLSVYSYFGQIASESYEEMADCLFESNWCEHPVELQKYVLLMVQNIQNPMYYHGFGIANLDLETFTDVSHDYLLLNQLQIKFLMKYVSLLKMSIYYSIKILIFYRC